MDPSSFSNIVSRSALPETLRLVPHGLQNIQLRVYEDFGDQSRFAASVSHHEAEYGQSGEVQGMQSTSASETMRNGVRINDSPSIPLGEVVESSIMTTKLTVAQSLEKFQELVMELDKLLSRADVDSLGQLPLHHDIKMIIRQIPVIATQSAFTDQTALAFSQKIVQLLYKSGSNLGREVWVSILQRLCDLFTKVAKEVMQWLIYAEDIVSDNDSISHLLFLLTHDLSILAQIQCSGHSHVDSSRPHRGSRVRRPAFQDDLPGVLPVRRRLCCSAHFGSGCRIRSLRFSKPIWFFHRSAGQSGSQQARHPVGRALTRGSPEQVTVLGCTFGG